MGQAKALLLLRSTRSRRLRANSCRPCRRQAIRASRTRSTRTGQRSRRPRRSTTLTSPCPQRTPGSITSRIISTKLFVALLLHPPFPSCVSGGTSHEHLGLPRLARFERQLTYERFKETPPTTFIIVVLLLLNSRVPSCPPPSSHPRFADVLTVTTRRSLGRHSSTHRVLLSLYCFFFLRLAMLGRLHV